MVIFNVSCVYKLCEYWRFRIGLIKENMNERKRLRTQSKALVIEKGIAKYLQIYTKIQQSKAYFSITTKERKESFLSLFMRNIELGYIQKRRYITIAMYPKLPISFIDADTNQKEIECAYRKNIFCCLHKATKGNFIQVTVQNEQCSTGMFKGSLAEGKA